MSPFRARSEAGAATLRLLAVAIIAALVGAAVVALLVNISERKAEARNPFFRVVELDDDTEDPAI
ncbi:MAG TPA: ammonia-forming cytochrome c nitrite reductase subunit c552, partial [Thermoanaerobaculia bacterium]|nr:ammonia-forming cytochrome c nitrite reductase subunit c552 [Thermoanaerobaculia bacterium]